MISSLESSIVRMHTSDGARVGAGFLVGDGLVLTCAHVVSAALDISEDAQEAPANGVLLDFPLVEPEHTLTARVIHWDAERDVAVLELTDTPPTDAQTMRLVTAKDLWGHHFRALGFPTSYDDGVWVSGVLRGRTGAGWVQIEDVKGPGYRVQPGFSGAPIWDEQFSGVVGMTVAADTDRVTKAAYMIPTRVLIEAWPEMAERSLEAGSPEHLRMQLVRLGANLSRDSFDPQRFLG